MKNHYHNREHMQWSLEDTGELLRTRFPDHHIWIIRPSLMKRGIFSAYLNFVESDDFGRPTHYSHQGSWKHLIHLLHSAAEKLHDEGNSPHLMFKEDFSVDIIGFSKGCVVLNQLLYDLIEHDEEVHSFVSKVRCMYWLDGGHGGQSNIWINDSTVLSAFARTNIKVECHVSPYQMCDSQRKWIKEEYETFTTMAKKLKIDIKTTSHFQDEERSIRNHFSVLREFKMQ